MCCRTYPMLLLAGCMLLLYAIIHIIYTIDAAAAAAMPSQTNNCLTYKPHYTYAEHCNTKWSSAKTPTRIRLKINNTWKRNRYTSVNSTRHY